MRGLPCDVVESPLLAGFKQKLDNHLWRISVVGGDWVWAFKALLNVRFYESLRDEIYPVHQGWIVGHVRVWSQIDLGSATSLGTVPHFLPQLQLPCCKMKMIIPTS